MKIKLLLIFVIFYVAFLKGCTYYAGRSHILCRSSVDLFSVLSTFCVHFLITNIILQNILKSESVRLLSGNVRLTAIYSDHKAGRGICTSPVEKLLCLLMFHGNTAERCYNNDNFAN
jgi:hypothetical protein